MRGEVRFIGRVTKAGEDMSTIEVLPEYCDGLYRLGEHRRLVILYWFHLRDDDRHRGTLQVVLRRHGETELRGVFASHQPFEAQPHRLNGGGASQR
jgi:tRNA (Thr-GGU) A37 N-methylase